MRIKNFAGTVEATEKRKLVVKWLSAAAQEWNTKHLEDGIAAAVRVGMRMTIHHDKNTGIKPVRFPANYHESLIPEASALAQEALTTANEEFEDDASISETEFSEDDIVYCKDNSGAEEDIGGYDPRYDCLTLFLIGSLGNTPTHHKNQMY